MNVRKNTSGLKKHSEEVNRVIIDSLIEALLLLMKEYQYEDISITMLCKKAGVSRMAFYGNFETKDDILKRIVSTINDMVVDEIGSPFKNNTDKEYYKKLFTIIDENRETLNLLFKAGFQYFYLERLNEIVIHEESSNEVVLQRLTWNGAIVNTVFYWLNNNNLSIDEIALYCSINLISVPYEKKERFVYLKNIINKIKSLKDN